MTVQSQSLKGIDLLAEIERLIQLLARLPDTSRVLVLERGGVFDHPWQLAAQRNSDIDHLSTVRIPAGHKVATRPIADMDAYRERHPTVGAVRAAMIRLLREARAQE